MPGYFGCESINKINRTLQITVHIARDSLGGTGYAAASLNAPLAYLNQVWAPIGIRFEICDIRYMDNFQFNEFVQVDHYNEMLAMYYQQNTINIYIVQSILLEEFGVVAGFATLPGGRDIIVVNKASSIGQSKTWVHEMGHFFGLYHTFETDFGDEAVNGSNCETTGDLVCDTEANPTDNPGDLPLPDCNYIGFPISDANGDAYVPPSNNYMSYTPCGCRFTPQQYNRMLEQYLQIRSYLW